MQNLNPASGLCNGTQRLIIKLGEQVIEGKLLMGSFSGDVVFIPHIALTSQSNVGLPFTLCQIQFPSHLTFGLTINKSQGQSLHHVSLHLIDPVFVHGQLYTGLSRTSISKNLKLLLDTSPAGCTNQTPNITYQELLTDKCTAIQNMDIDVD